MLFSEDLLHRLVASDAACVGGRLGIIARRPGNPLGAMVSREGDVHAFRCRIIQSPSFNRVIGLTEANASDVADHAAWLRRAGPRGRIEVPAARCGAALGRALAAARFELTGFAAMLVATPGGGDAETPVSIELVGDPATMDLFLETHLTGWGIEQANQAGAKDNMRLWLALPGWTMLLARIGGVPAGTAVLHCADGVAYCADATTRPEWRGRGVQSALLRRRRRMAAELGADVVWSSAAFPSQSYRNMMRVGFSLLCNVAIWSDARDS